MRTAAIMLSVALTAIACGGEPTDTTNDSSTTVTTGFVPDTLPENLLADWSTPETGLVMKFPVDWLPDEDVENGFVGFTAPPIEGDTFIENFNVVVVDLPDGMQLAQYVAQDGIRLASAIEGYVVVGGYEATLAGVDATAVAFDGETEGVEISVLRLLAVVDGRGIEFTFLASRHEFENFSPVIQQLIDSISLN